MELLQGIADGTGGSASANYHCDVIRREGKEMGQQEKKKKEPAVRRVGSVFAKCGRSRFETPNQSVLSPSSLPGADQNAERKHEGNNGNTLGARYSINCSDGLCVGTEFIEQRYDCLLVRYRYAGASGVGLTQLHTYFL